jgi:hypothetical protein
MTNLSLLDSGSYLVRTASGALYDVDLDAGTLHRRPADQEPDLALADASEDMRRDGETLKLLSIAVCTVGVSAVFAIDLGVDGVPVTTRFTTAVASIDKVDTRELETAA